MMTHSEFRVWLATLAESQATIPAAEVLKRLPDGVDSPRAAGDMTLEQVANEVGRATSTVRTWCNSNRIAGAYRLNGRDWRIPQASLRKFLDEQGRGATQNEIQNGEGEWDSWRGAS